MPGPIGLMSAIGDYFYDGPRYTGYNPPKRKEDDWNNDSLYRRYIPLPIKPYDPNENLTYKSSASVYNQNPDQDNVNTSGINSLRRR